MKTENGWTAARLERLVMPDLFFQMNGRPAVLTIGGNYKPGDMPPNGYCEWHEWADVQHKAGLRQVVCDRCLKWKFPQEILRTETRKSVVYRTKADMVCERNAIFRTEQVPICRECEKA